MTTAQTTSTIYLIPAPLDEAVVETIPPYVLDSVKNCHAFFVEDERSARRYLKSIWKEMVIDDYIWVPIHKAENPVKSKFIGLVKQGKNIGIISEAGCPGIADPGQLLIAAAHTLNAKVKPLTGPSSILLALMAGGMNGQRFQFIGYLPIDSTERTKLLRQLESESIKKDCTQVFIETPYRNNQLIETILRTCQHNTVLSLAADLTSEKEWIKTQSIAEWKKQVPDLHKRPTIFSLYHPPAG